MIVNVSQVPPAQPEVSPGLITRQAKLGIRIVNSYLQGLRWIVGLGRRSGFYIPQTRVFENLLYDMPVLDESQNFHPAVALGTR